MSTPMSTDHALAPSSESASAAAPRRALTMRLHDAADLIAFMGLLNVLMIVGALAGGLIFGIAPTLAAAVTTARARLRGDGGSAVRRFFAAWREQFVRANLLQAPAALVIVMLAVNLLAFGGDGVLGTVLIATLCIVIVYQLLVITMDAHYDLRRRDTLRLSGGFLVRSPGAPLLLAATLALLSTITVLLPGLLPVLSIGAACYLTTALCLSFFEANDMRVGRAESPQPAPPTPSRHRGRHLRKE